MRRTFMIILICLLAVSAFAAVEPYWIFLSETGLGGAKTTWSVPAGKIFIIKAVWISASGTPQPTNTQIRFSVDADNMVGSSYMNAVIADDYDPNSLRWLPEDMPVKAGKSLAVPNNATYPYVRYYGLLIDEADLYAQNIPAELNNVEMVGGLFQAEARFASARPRITRIESSTLLNSFESASAGMVTPGDTRDQSLVSIPDTDQRKFMRVIATARN